jgi:hypothetical protein
VISGPQSARSHTQVGWRSGRWIRVAPTRNPDVGTVALPSAPSRQGVARSEVARAGFQSQPESSAPGERPVVEQSRAAATRWLVGDGGVSDLIRAKDWSQTPLGPVELWSESLRTSVSLILASLFPINLIWGDGAVQIWNDAYAVICAEKHPVMFGSDYRECWRSAWSGVGAAFESARAGRTAFLQDQPMFLDRNGYLEETWSTFSMSPIRDERGDIVGLFLPVTETSGQMLSDRRTRTLHALSARAGQARTIPEAVAAAIAVLAEAGLDVSLALVSMRDDEAGCARLDGHTGVEAGTAISPREIPLDGDLPVAIALREGATIVLDDLLARYGAVSRSVPSRRRARNWTGRRRRSSPTCRTSSARR